MLIPNPQSKQIACSVIPPRKVIIYFLKNVDLTTLSACCLGSWEAFGKGMPTLRRLEESVVQPLVCQNTGLIISRSSLLAWRLSANHLQSPQEQQILRTLNLNFFSKLQPAYMYATVNSSWQPLCSGPFFFSLLCFGNFFAGTYSSSIACRSSFGTCPEQTASPSSKWWELVLHAPLSLPSSRSRWNFIILCEWASGI